MISDRTVEETILKKAQQKRMLCNMAIEGGNFTTAFFKEDSVRDLFNTDKDNQNEEVVAVTKPLEAAKEEKTESIQEPQNNLTNEQYEKVID